MKDRMIYMRAAYDCIQSIDEYIAGYDLEQFLKDKKTQDAVIRNLEVLGQTVKDFGIDDLKQDYPALPWSQVAGMRNIIAHEYLGLDMHIIWETVRNHLDPIKSAIQDLLGKGLTHGE
jgi:uncharacterized protein with HEPN domain